MCEKCKEVNCGYAYGHHPRLLMWYISNEYSGENYCELCQERFGTLIKENIIFIGIVNETAFVNAQWPKPLNELFGIEELETLYPQEYNEIPTNISL